MNVAYGTCDSHTAYATKPAARRGIRNHKRWHAELNSCWKCNRGWVLGLFACDASTRPHFHVGHTPQGWRR